MKWLSRGFQTPRDKLFWASEFIKERARLQLDAFSNIIHHMSFICQVKSSRMFEHRPLQPLLKFFSTTRLDIWMCELALNKVYTNYWKWVKLNHQNSFESFKQTSAFNEVGYFHLIITITIVTINLSVRLKTYSSSACSLLKCISEKWLQVLHLDVPIELLWHFENKRIKTIYG